MNTVLAALFTTLCTTLCTVACAPAANSESPAVPGAGAPAPHLRTAASSTQRPRPASERGVPSSAAHAGRHPRADDPDPARERDVSLAEILAHADRHSPSLLVARATRARAAAEHAAAAPLLESNPELTLALGPRLGSAPSALELDVTLMQQVSLTRERSGRLGVAHAVQDVTDAEIEQVRWQVHCEVHAAFHHVLVENERTRLARRVLEFQEEVLRIVERQIAAGEAAALSLRLAEAEVAQARQTWLAAEQATLRARLRLAQSSGWPVISPPTPTGRLDEPRLPPALHELTQLARHNVPSLHTAAMRVGEASARTELATRQGWPRPALGVQYRREGNLTEEGSNHTLMGVVSVPIPSFQTNQAGRAQARAELVVAEAQESALEQQLQGQVAQAHSEVVAAAQRTKAYGAEILPRFEENLTLLRRSFELGEIDLLALSTGRERFLRIQSDALDAQRDYYEALAGLERVVGVDLWHDDPVEAHAP